MIPYLKHAVQNTLIDFGKSESSPSEPISLSVMKDYLKVTFTDDDSDLTSLIVAARKSVEDFCNITIVAKTVLLIADLYTEFELPMGPLNSFTSAALKTAINTYTVAVANTDYEIDGVSYSRFIPITPGRYKLVYTTANPDIADDLILAIKQEVAFRFENKGETIQIRTGAKPGVCEAAEYLAGPYRRMQWL